MKKCSSCLLSTQDQPNLSFDSAGRCSICLHYSQQAPLRQKSAAELETLVAQLRKAGKGKPYDALIGLSGGTDSSYVALLCRDLGLRVLAVHLDNGWNSERAVLNMERILSRLNIDLYTYVVPWEEFRDLQRAYIRAGVIDIEVLTDHAIAAILFRLARKFDVGYILSGEHFATEGQLPSNWVHNKLDHLNILGIHRQFGEIPIPSYPLMSYYRYRWGQGKGRARSIPILNYLDYQKDAVKLRLSQELGWQDYGGKHHESVFTRFYQAYILPIKFDVDKRKSHLSTLIAAGQLIRTEAEQELAKPICPPELLEKDKRFVLKKLGFSEAEFDFFMAQPPVPHLAYPSVIHALNRISRPWKRVKGVFSSP